MFLSPVWVIFSRRSQLFSTSFFRHSYKLKFVLPIFWTIFKIFVQLPFVTTWSSKKFFMSNFVVLKTVVKHPKYQCKPQRAVASVTREFFNLMRSGKNLGKNLGRSYLGKNLGSCLLSFLQALARCYFKIFSKII